MRKINLHGLTVNCSDCNGSGEKPGGSECRHCLGLGTIPIGGFQNQSSTTQSKQKPSRKDLNIEGLPSTA